MVVFLSVENVSCITCDKALEDDGSNTVLIQYLPLATCTSNRCVFIFN